MPGQPFFLGSTNPQKPGSAQLFSAFPTLYYHDVANGGSGAQRRMPASLSLPTGRYVFVACGAGGTKGSDSSAVAGAMAVATRNITSSDIVGVSVSTGGDVTLNLPTGAVVAGAGSAAGLGVATGGDVNLSGSGVLPPTYQGYEGSGYGSGGNIGYGPASLLILRIS